MGIFIPAPQLQQLAHQQVGAEAAQDKGRKQQKIRGDGQPEDELQRDAEQPVERRQGVKGQVDVDRVEHPAAVEEVGVELVDQPQLDPPEVPRQRRIVDAVAGDVRGEVRGQRPGEGQRQQRIYRQGQAGTLPAAPEPGARHQGAVVLSGGAAGVPAGVTSGVASEVASDGISVGAGPME